MPLVFITKKYQKPTLSLARLFLLLLQVTKEAMARVISQK